MLNVSDLQSAVKIVEKLDRYTTHQQYQNKIKYKFKKQKKKQTR
jgi:hypothetical protein